MTLVKAVYGSVTVSCWSTYPLYHKAKITALNMLAYCQLFRIVWC